MGVELSQIKGMGRMLVFPPILSVSGGAVHPTVKPVIIWNKFCSYAYPARVACLTFFNSMGMREINR